MFENSIEELNQRIQVTLQNISLGNYKEHLYIVALKEILNTESKVNIITYVTLLVGNIKTLDISDYTKITYLGLIAKILYIEINTFKEIRKEIIVIPNRTLSGDDINNAHQLLKSNIKTHRHFVIDEDTHIYKIDGKEPGMQIYKTIASKFELQAAVYIKKELSQNQQSSRYFTLDKYVLNEAIQIAGISELYGIAGYYFKYTADFDFTVELYQKAIDCCYKIKNTSKLHLLGQSMLLCGTEYFTQWGESIKKEAKKLSDQQKLDDIEGK